MKIYFEKIEGFNTKLPTYGSEESAGMDVYLPDYTKDQIDEYFPVICTKTDTCKLRIYPNDVVKIPLGIRCAFDKGYVLLVKNRSSLASRGIIKTAQVIDSDYRGQLFACLTNIGNCVETLQSGDRVIQLILMPYIHAEIESGIPDDLKVTKRDQGGFGSTGK